MRRTIVFSIMAMCCGSAVNAQDQAKAVPVVQFKAGFAYRDISPKAGMEQPGGYVKSFHKDQHDACKVRASVFDNGTSPVAVVGIDSLIIRRPQVVAARNAIAAKTSIKPEAIMISASHSHAGGPTGMVLPGEYDHSDKFTQRLAYEESSAADADYLIAVEKAITEAVLEAWAKRVPAKASAGFGIEGKVAFNRRFKMTNGLTFTHPGQGNPDIITPAGPIDPQVGVLGVWSMDNKPLGCIVNYACHATTGPGGSSADYIYYIERAIQGVYPEMAVVFLPGMAGDVTQVDNRLGFKIAQSGEAASRYVGASVGAEALKTLLVEERSAAPLGPIAFESKNLKIARRAPSPDRVSKSRELAAKPKTAVDMTDWTFAKEIVMLAARMKTEPVADVEVQAIQVGPAVFLSCPAEYFCQFGLDIKAGSPFPVTMPVSMANDCIGYVPTAEALGPGGGGYETRLTSYSNLIPTAGRTIADSLILMARKMKPGVLPTPPPWPGFSGKPWAYGDVPPELD